MFLKKVKKIYRGKGEESGNYRHGHCLNQKVSSTYATWATMVARCENPNVKKFPRYGGRGIKVCKKWRKSFKAFLTDMGVRPTSDHMLGRIDNDGDYKPSNCRWETRKQQARNTRTNHFLEFKGRIATMAEWSEITGISYDCIKQRINNLQWTVEKSLTQLVKHLCPD